MGNHRGASRDATQRKTHGRFLKKERSPAQAGVKRLNPYPSARPCASFVPFSAGKIGKCRSIPAVMSGPDKLLPYGQHDGHKQNSAYRYEVHMGKPSERAVFLFTVQYSQCGLLRLFCTPGTCYTFNNKLFKGESDYWSKKLIANYY